MNYILDVMIYIYIYIYITLVIMINDDNNDNNDNNAQEVPGRAGEEGGAAEAWII